VNLWDERLTTASAIGYLNMTDTRGKKRKAVVDTVAATIILQDYAIICACAKSGKHRREKAAASPPFLAHTFPGFWHPKTENTGTGRGTFMPTFEELYEQVAKSALAGESEQQIRAKTLHFDRRALACLLHPEKYAPVWRTGDLRLLQR